MEISRIKEGHLKNDIQALSETIINRLNEGETDPLEMLATIKAYEKVFENVKKDLMNNALTEAGKYAEKEFKVFGVKFNKAEAGVVYDYSQCGHIDYNNVCEEIKRLTEIKKEYEKTLQTIKQLTPMISSEGEIMEVIPPTKKSTTVLKVTI